LCAGRYVAAAINDTRLHKTGRHIQSAFYQRDPLSPKFRFNLMFPPLRPGKWLKSRTAILSRDREGLVRGSFQKVPRQSLSRRMGVSTE